MIQAVIDAKGVESTLFFEDIGNLTTVVELEELHRNPDMIYHHFMNYGDEVFYILKNNKMYGIVTPGDLYRSKSSEKVYINTSFQYIASMDDVEAAYKIFGKYPTIHEIAIVKDEMFMGVMKSGKRKTVEEWRKIRESLQAEKSEENAKGCLDDIYKLLKLKCPMFVYPYLVTTKNEMQITNKEHKLFVEKASYYNGPKDISFLPLKEQQEFFGEYTWKYHQQLPNLWSLLKVELKNGIPKYKAVAGNELYAISGGYRSVPGTERLNARRKIFTVGPCTMFGVYTANEETIQAYLQEKLVENGFEDYEVVNLSVATELSIARLFNEKISEDDIIIIMTNQYNLWKSVADKYEENLTCVDDLGSIWSKIENPLSCLYDSYNHCNWRVNREIAHKMYEDISSSLSREIKEVHRERLQDYYISPEIAVYYRKHFLLHVGEQHQGVIGSIVMNCNPFTKGHRYLIEKAVSQVE